jgi:hypothetical protein
MRLSAVNVRRTNGMSLKKLMPNIVIIALMFHVSSTQGHAQAKTETPKIELGLQFAMVNLGGVKPVLPGSTNPGFGGRITWNLNHRYSGRKRSEFFSERFVRTRP